MENEKCKCKKNMRILMKRFHWTKFGYYISDPTNIVKHGFYPFIHYEKKFNKFTRKDGRGYIKEKSRHLCYSAHIDRYIYSYYGYLLNQKYNKYLEERNMNLVAVAYRDNLHKNNIHFAKELLIVLEKRKKVL